MRNWISTLRASAVKVVLATVATVFEEDRVDRDVKGGADHPRDRAGTFDPKLIAKYQRRFPDFDAKIISMYARGMKVREIQGHLEELYGLDVSPDLISAVTDAGGGRRRPNRPQHQGVRARQSNRQGHHTQSTDLTEPSRFS